MYKFAISKLGYNILTETNINNLVFSSDYNTLKYYVSGSITLNINYSGTSYNVNQSIAHNLGYKPFFVAYAKDSNSLLNYRPVGIFQFNSPNFLTRIFLVTVDATNIYFTAKGDSLSGETYSVTFYYKIFKNNLNL